MKDPIISLDQYQKEAYKTALYKNKIIYPTLGLASEAGEVAGKVKKVLRDKDGNFDDPEIRLNIAKELGDVLWYVATTAQDLGFSLSEIAEMNIDKLRDRAERDAIKGSGDNR